MRAMGEGEEAPLPPPARRIPHVLVQEGDERPRIVADIEPIEAPNREPDAGGAGTGTPLVFTR